MIQDKFDSTIFNLDDSIDYHLKRIKELFNSHPIDETKEMELRLRIKACLQSGYNGAASLLWNSTKEVSIGLINKHFEKK